MFFNFSSEIVEIIFQQEIEPVVDELRIPLIPASDEGVKLGNLSIIS